MLTYSCTFETFLTAKLYVHVHVSILMFTFSLVKYLAKNALVSAGRGKSSFLRDDFMSSSFALAKAFSTTSAF